MPELPEVETIRRGLSLKLVGQTVSRVNVRLNKAFLGNPDSILNTQINNVDRKGKLMILQLGPDVNHSDWALLVHLRMTGQLFYVANENKQTENKVYDLSSLPNNWTRVEIVFESGDILYFNDTRTFGYFKLIPFSQINEDSFITKLGLEPLKENFTFESFKNLTLKRFRGRIKHFLLDQTAVAGIGNIYADEALFEAQIHPERLIGSLSESEIEKLYLAIIKVLSEGVKLGGASKTSYYDIEGGTGDFLKSNSVYGRKGQTCLTCGTKIEKTTVAGRGTHFCPNCQR